MRQLSKLLPSSLLLVSSFVGCSGEGDPSPALGSNTSVTAGAGGSSTLSSSSAASSVGGMSSVTATTQGVSASTASVGGASAEGSTGSESMSGSTGTGQGGMTSSASTGQGGTTSESVSAGGTDSTTTGSATTGGAVDVEPSAGCSNGSASPTLNLNNTIVSVPPSYDGSTPVPVVMAFHAAGNPNTQLQDRFADNWEDKYLVLYPKSAGNGWNDGTDGPVVDAMFNAITNEACIDENRVFASGHSSGAQFIVQRLCAGESRWRAVAPIASSEYCSSWDPVPALVIHGIGDVERSWDPDGEQDIVPYRTSNGCEQTSSEFPVEGCSSSGTQVDPGCVAFDGCSERTLWCQHNDPQYGTSHHGIPCFADMLIPEFFDSF